MADVPSAAPSAAQSLYPNLPSSAAASADRAPPAADRSAAASIYGNSPSGGIDRARDVMAAGVAGAQPTSPAADAGKPAAKDWLAEVSERDQDAPREVPKQPAAGTGTPLDVKGLGLDESDLAYDFAALAGEFKLSRGAAREFVDLHRAAVTDASTQYWNKQTADWEKASTTQFGARLPAMVDAVKPLLNGQLTTPGFRALLETYKLGSNPDVIETLSRWANAMPRRR